MIKYSDFLKKNIDISVLGFNVKGEFYPYYCTPENSKILGFSGVDGIHYCTVRNFGETIFAVSPMNFGACVHPIAQNFEDLLRLLLKAGDMAILEQCYAWDREQFEASCSDLSLTSEHNKALNALKTEYKLSPITDPYGYIKKLQAGFDYSAIPYTDDYYDVDMNPAAPPRENKWEVRFEGGYWASKNKSHPGEETSLDRSFVWGGKVWHVPAIYTCSKGFVVDFCIETDPEIVSAYYGKWMPICEYCEMISSDLQEQIEKENPLDCNFTPTLIINGNEVKASQGSSLNFLPAGTVPNGAESPIEALQAAEHYKLDTAKAWSFHRWSFPRTNAKKIRIKDLNLKLELSPETIKGICFSSPKEGDSINFVHPVSGTKHILRITGYQQSKFPPNAFAENFEYPTHHTLMTYTLDPDIPDTKFTIRDKQNNDAPKNKPAKQYEPTSNYDACIGVIGGADGPTAVFAKITELHTAISALHFEPQKDVEWQITFREKTIPDIKIHLISREEE